MKKVLFTVYFLMFVSVCIAQKIFNDAQVELRNVSGFHAIEVSSGIHLYISHGEEAVAVSAMDANIRNRIHTEVKDGVLKIWYEWKEGMRVTRGSNYSLKAYVSYKNLDQLSASSGSDIKVDGTIQASSFSLNISGGSDFSGKVDISVLKVNQSGGSDVDISGSASSLRLLTSGGSDFDGYGLITNDGIISASGGSDVNITVNKEIDAEASGASDISWKGTATVKKAKGSGAGSVSHKS